MSCRHVVWPKWYHWFIVCELASDQFSLTLRAFWVGWSLWFLCFYSFFIIYYLFIYYYFLFKKAFFLIYLFSRAFWSCSRYVQPLDTPNALACFISRPKPLPRWSIYCFDLNWYRVCLELYLRSLKVFLIFKRSV